MSLKKGKTSIMFNKQYFKMKIKILCYYLKFIISIFIQFVHKLTMKFKILIIKLNLI